MMFKYSWQPSWNSCFRFVWRNSQKWLMGVFLHLLDNLVTVVICIQLSFYFIYFEPVKIFSSILNATLELVVILSHLSVKNFKLVKCWCRISTPSLLGRHVWRCLHRVSPFVSCVAIKTILSFGRPSRNLAIALPSSLDVSPVSKVPDVTKFPPSSKTTKLCPRNFKLRSTPFTLILQWPCLSGSSEPSARITILILPRNQQILSIHKWKNFVLLTQVTEREKYVLIFRKLCAKAVNILWISKLDSCSQSADAEYFITSCFYY